MVDRIYGGDVERCRSRGPKQASLRTAAGQPDFQASPAALSRSVAIYALSLRRKDLVSLLNLGPSHVREVVRLSSAVQDRLLNRANKEKWSVVRLREQVSRLHSSEGAQRTAPRRAPVFAGQIRRLKRAIDDRVLLNGIDHARELKPAEAAALLHVVQQLCSQTEALAHHLAKHAGLRAHERAALGPAAARHGSSELSAELLPRGNSNTKKKC